MDALLFIVVNRGKANSILRKAQEYGASGGTIFLGEGTVQSRFLEKLGLAETHKEILMIPTSHERCENLHKMLRENFALAAKHKGIAFSIPFKRWQSQEAGEIQENPFNSMSFSHSCIITIVDKGKSRDCIKAAKAAGARGGTLIHGRGAGIPTDYYFPLVIEPQKDIVMIITTNDKATPIRDKISSELELEKTGKGIIFILPVTSTSGLFENRAEERKGAIS